MVQAVDRADRERGTPVLGRGSVSRFSPVSGFGTVSDAGGSSLHAIGESLRAACRKRTGVEGCTGLQDAGEGGVRPCEAHIAQGWDLWRQQCAVLGHDPRHA